MANDDSRDDDDRSQGLLSETLKKVVTAGIGAAFMTEESIRAYLSEIKLPKDVLNGVLHGASKSKNEIINRVSDEVIKIVRKIDFVEEASRFVEEHKFRVSAEIEVVKKSPESRHHESAPTTRIKVSTTD